MGNLKETHNVFLRFFFPWEKPFGNHKTCLLMGFSRGNTTWRQQCYIFWLLLPLEYASGPLSCSSCLHVGHGPDNFGLFV